MKNLLFNNRFVYQQAAPSPKPPVEEIEMEPLTVEAEQEKPASLEELQAALEEGKREMFAHFRAMEALAKDNPVVAKMLEDMKKTNKMYQEYLEKRKGQIKGIPSVLDYIPPKKG